jgi:hypothetical protein
MRLISQLVENHDGVRRQVVIPLFSQGQALRKQESSLVPAKPVPA